MNIERAIEILDQYKDVYGYPHMLEALQGIQADYDAQSPQVQTAYRVFMQLGRKMFDVEEEV
jgi:hypothetical protein